MTTTQDLIERLEKPSGTAYYDAERAAAAVRLREQEAEIARLKETERNCWSSPAAWTAWCDVRVLERAEKAEAERDAAQGDLASRKMAHTVALGMLEKAYSERDALRQDAERLDWIMSQFANWWPDRAAIDAARKEKP